LILNEVRVGRGQVRAHVGDLAALFFVHQRTVPDRAEWDSDHPAHLLGNPGLGEGLKAKDVGPALGRVLAAWADSRPADDPVSHQCFALAVGQAPFPEAAPVLTRLARDPKAQPLNVRALAVSALGKVGDGPA